MDFIYRLDLGLRNYIRRAYNLVAPLISKTGINKLRLGGRTLGDRAYSLFLRALHFKISDPIAVNGFILYHHSSGGRGYFGWLCAFGFEPETQGLFTQIVRPAMTVADIGANIGYYSLLSARLTGDRGRVFAFEPDPAYYALLKKNIEANGFGAIIEPLNLAAGDTEKQATLFLGESTSTSFFPVPDLTGQKTIAEVISLDRFFSERGWPPVDLIKIDVEGAEKMVLEGMRGLIERNRDLKLVIELNPSFLSAADTSAEELLGLLSGLGFDRVCVLSGEMKVYIIPQDISYLANLGRKSGYVNLFCEGHHVR